MSGYRIYPRLSGLAAEQLVAQLVSRSGPPAWSDRHEEQTYTSIGSPVEASVLVGVRRAVEDALRESAIGPVERGNAAEWDRVVGWALHRATTSPGSRMSPMEAASTEVWSWMTLVLMPDIALQRFPDASSVRMHGGPRNVFRKVWWRVEVLGDLADPKRDGVLGEDELVGIFERTSLARNRPIARAIFRCLSASKDSGRTEYARALSRTVLRDLAHLSPALMDDPAADALVASADRRISLRAGEWVYTG